LIILFIDVLCLRGHKVFNSFTLSSLLELEQFKVLFVGSRNCINDGQKVNYEIPEEYFLNIKDTNFMLKLKYRLLEFKKWLWILPLIKRINPDLVILSSYETITFSLFSNFVPSKVIAFNHNNIDELNNRIKRVFYKFISKKVIQVVFEDYMKEYLEREIRIKNKILILPHIVDKNRLIEEDSSITEKSDPLILFAPSSSNDRKVIKELIKKQEQLLEKGIYLIGKYYCNMQGRSLLLKEYFTDSEYEKFIKLCSGVYVPLPITFNYRVSNVINEAISYGKPVISHLNKYTLFLKERYSSLIYILNEDIIRESQKIKRWLENISSSFLEDRKNFLEEHSSARFIELFKNFLEEEKLKL